MARSYINPLLVCAGAGMLISLVPQARASDLFTVNIVQSGSNVVATGSGSFSVSGPTDDGTANEGVEGSDAYLILGSGDNDVLTGVTGPSNFGSGGSIVTPSSTTGGEVGFGLTFNSYVVPFGYVAGAPLTSSSTWDSTTLAGLGLTVGTYTYALGDGDSFVINVGSTTPEPASLLLTGIGILGLTVGFRKRVGLRKLKATGL
ncbi:MAG TPA: PEP-CTERM sorting domain-containing protein [Bryobacteraceae bacterium]